MKKTYKRPEPHPIFEAIGVEVPCEPLAMIEGFVCPSKEGLFSLVPALDMRARFDISESDIKYIESTGEDGQHKVRVYVSDTADISVYEYLAEGASVKASEISAALETSGLAAIAALAPGSGSGSDTSGLDCLTRCAREKRRCLGLFPTTKKSAECERKYNACRKACIDAEDQLIIF